MQQWARRYLQLAQAQTTLYKRARTRAYLFEGVQTFRLSQAVEAVPALLHVAVFLFFVGLVDFLFSINASVAHAVLGAICLCGCTYILLTFLSNVRPNCPYRTPFSRDSLKYLLVLPTAPVLLGLYCLRCVLHSDRSERLLTRLSFFMQSLLWTMHEATRALQADIDRKALQWAIATVDDDDDIETLIEGIPGFLTSGTSRSGLSIIEDLLQPQQPTPLGHHINRLIQSCTPEGYHRASETVRRRRALICLNTTRFLTGVYFASFSYGMFGYQTWPSVNSLKRDEDPVVAINAVSTGALAARAYLRAIFVEGIDEPDRPKKLAELVNAPWPKNGLYSFAGCHLLVLHSFISGLLPHLKSDEVTPTSFRAVWETLPRILNKYPRGDPEPHVRALFMALWEELGTLAGTEPPDIPWASAMISGTEPIRFKKPVMDANVLPPVVQLMSMLRPLVEELRALNDRDAQEIQGGAVPSATEQVGQSSSTPIPNSESGAQGESVASPVDQSAHGHLGGGVGE